MPEVLVLLGTQRMQKGIFLKKSDYAHTYKTKYERFQTKMFHFASQVRTLKSLTKKYRTDWITKHTQTDRQASNQ